VQIEKSVSEPEMDDEFASDEPEPLLEDELEASL
jgi:hypothetical protein